MATLTNEDNPELFGALSRSAQAKVNHLGNQLVELVEDRKGAEQAENEIKDTLKPLALQAYFEHNEDIIGEDACHTFDFGGSFQVNFSNAYFIKDAAHAQRIIATLGPRHPLAALIKKTSKVVITGCFDDPKFIKYAQALAALNKAHGIKAVTEDGYAVDPSFHNVRHEVLSAEDNLELNKVLPTVVSFTPLEF